MQGLFNSNALLLAEAVLVRQNRITQLVEQRAHLDLKTNLLAEHKVGKLLQPVTEMRQVGGDAAPLDSEAANWLSPLI